MTDTPTPAQQLEEVLALQAAAKQSRARNEPATADQLEAYADEIILDMGRKHAPTLRRALDALKAVEKMRAWAHELRTFKEVGVAGATAYKIAGEVLAALPPADAVEVK